MENHEINKRIKKIIDYKADSNVAKFAEIINIRQQTVNRLFNIDTRTNKYPLVTTEIVVAITEICVDINPFWLLTGGGDMLCDKISNMVENSKHSIGDDVGTTDATILYSIIQDLQRKNEELQRELGRKEVKIEYLEDEIKKRRASDAEYAYTHDIANVG